MPSSSNLLTKPKNQPRHVRFKTRKDTFWYRHLNKRLYGLRDDSRYLKINSVLIIVSNIYRTPCTSHIELRDFILIIKITIYHAYMNSA